MMPEKEMMMMLPEKEMMIRSSREARHPVIFPAERDCPKEAIGERKAPTSWARSALRSSSGGLQPLPAGGLGTP